MRAPLRIPPCSALAVALAACGGGGPKQTLEKLASTAATAHLAAAELQARHTTARYTASTLDVLSRAVEQDAERLEPGELPDALRGQALAAVVLARRSLAALDSAAHHRDTVALAAAAQRADSADRALHAVTDRLPER